MKDRANVSALPGGARITDGSFGDAGDGGYWWTATEGSRGGAYSWVMGYGNDYVREGIGDVGNGFSVRCVKNDVR